MRQEVGLAFLWLEELFHSSLEVFQSRVHGGFGIVPSWGCPVGRSVEPWVVVGVPALSVPAKKNLSARDLSNLLKVFSCMWL